MRIRLREQCDADVGAAPVVGREFDPPTVRRDNTVADGEAEARSRARGLGRKERIEDMRAMFGAMPIPLSAKSIVISSASESY